ncbi:MAG: SOS response-associated peptidase [Deltaproteobacteria bacterium]|nr:SOS response-associated peptidase [Deltaproteobacteria bacterium]
MCGRYTLTASMEDLLAEFDLLEPLAIKPRYNVAPTQFMPVIRVEEPKESTAPSETPRRQAVLMRWGLTPSWAKDAAIANRTINARSETVATQASFRAAFKRRRCLVPCSGFYEWKVIGEKNGQPVKQPYLIRPASGGLLALAGLWECWRPADAEPVHTYTILTTGANTFMAALHERMPVIVGRENYTAWLDPQSQDPGVLQGLLQPARCDLGAIPVNTRVNNVRNDDAACLDGVNEGTLFG